MKKAKVSHRGDTVPKSAIRKLMPLAAETRKRGVNIIPLNIGQPDIETPGEFWEGIRNFGGKYVAYSPSAGQPDYLKVLVEYYGRLGISLSEEEIIVTTGGIEGVQYSLLAVTDPGDEVIVPEPYYSNYIGAAATGQITFVPITTRADNGYHLPPREEIEKLITPKTKAMLFSTPSNPTGCTYTREEMEMLAAIGRDNGLFLLSDEVYREFVYDGAQAVSILQLDNMDDHGVIIDSVSKRYSLCGARIGCIASRNKGFMSAINALATVRLSAPTLDQAGVANCINTPQAYFDKVRNEYIERRNIVVEALNSVEDVVCHSPEGAFYVMPRLTGIDTEEFSRWLLTDFSHNNETVLVAPGAGFYTTQGLGRDEIRIAYVFKAEIMKRAMDILVKAIREFRKVKG